jgi:hypothetical protein
MVFYSIIGFLNYRKNIVRYQNPISIYYQLKPERPVSALAMFLRLNEGPTAALLVENYLN